MEDEKRIEWEALAGEASVADMTEPERVAYFAQLEAWTVPITWMSAREIDKLFIEQVVDRLIEEHGETLKKLGDD